MMVALFDNAAEETAIAALLASPAGYEIGLFDELTAYRLENGKYSVTERIRSRVDQPHDYEKFFDDAQEAAAFFIERRKYRQLGFDYERDPDESMG